MHRASLIIAFVLGLFLVLSVTDQHPALTQASHAVKDAQTFPSGIASSPGELASAPSIESSSLEQDDSTSGAEKPKTFEQWIKGTERLDGLFTLYRDRTAGKLYAEIKPNQLDVNYLCTITLESGIGESFIYSGLPLESFLFRFQRVNQRLQFVVPNVYFRTRPGDPLQRSVARAFSDSTLQTLPIRSIHPRRKSFLVDLGPLLLGDLPNLTRFLSLSLDSSYTLDTSKSYLGPVKVFPQNVELESVYGFSSGSSPEELSAFITALPDSRTFNLRVRYSLSQLPTNNGYRPRLADDRIGYFITAYQNLSEESAREPFVRYINRWHLEKQIPAAPLSPPKRPIVFWLENTIPLEYRDAVRDGILMWNKAFEQAGFKNAIEVRQMPNNATWDPADTRYNTIRWLTSFRSAFVGLGPIRSNPLTGEILDADILIDASFVRYLKRQYQSLVEQDPMQLMPSLAKLTRNPDVCRYGVMPSTLKRTVKSPSRSQLKLHLLGNYDLCYGFEAAQQFAIGSVALATLHNALPNGEEMKRYIQQFLRELVAHEVGHTLGLRHNFRASTLLSPAELNNSQITQQQGLTASVMDYNPVNLAPQGMPQGDYFTQTVGAYDEWAIAYGYTPTPARSPQQEVRLLEPIARRAPEPALAYATDEDTSAELDPQAQPFDLSADLLTYAPWQLENAHRMWERLDRRYPTEGGSFNDVRMVFDNIYNYYFQYARLLTTYVGGQSFNRYRAGDAVGRLPFEPIPLGQQRQALALLQKYVFNESMFRFSPNLLNKLAPSRWEHWGADAASTSLDYPIHDRILLLQSVVLRQLLDHDRLARLRDADLRASPDQVLTIPELFTTLQTTIWRGVLHPQDKLQLSSLQRGLQREYLNVMTSIVLRTVDVPEDARTVAWYHLKQLRTALETALRRKGKGMDTYTRAHLEETHDRIVKSLNAQLQAQ